MRQLKILLGPQATGRAARSRKGRSNCTARLTVQTVHCSLHTFRYVTWMAWISTHNADSSRKASSHWNRPYLQVCNADGRQAACELRHSQAAEAAVNQTRRRDQVIPRPRCPGRDRLHFRGSLRRRQLATRPFRNSSTTAHRLALPPPQTCCTLALLASAYIPLAYRVAPLHSPKSLPGKRSGVSALRF
jgi:hypothetical protein